MEPGWDTATIWSSTNTLTHTHTPIALQIYFCKKSDFRIEVKLNINQVLVHSSQSEMYARPFQHVEDVLNVVIIRIHAVLTVMWYF